MSARMLISDALIQFVTRFNNLNQSDLFAISDQVLPSPAAVLLKCVNTLLIFMLFFLFTFIVVVGYYNIDLLSCRKIKFSFHRI